MANIVAAFEVAWRSAADGKTRPRLEAVLEGVPFAERTSYLRELLTVELHLRASAGENPDLTDYLARFPADASIVHAAFNACSTIPVREQPSTEHSCDSIYSSDGAIGPLLLPDDQTLKPKTMLGNYTIINQIGQGGMGAVYQAEHRRMRRKVAIKIISPAALQHSESAQRFQHEVQAVSRLEHPNIVTAHDADQVGDRHFLVMQYVNGRDLSTTVRRYGPLNVELALRCLAQAARGLEHAHHAGVIHRDIKPANLILAADGEVKILDMGLARFEEALPPLSSLETSGLTTSLENARLTASGMIMGTIDFMAPEQARDARTADCRADIYSLGCTLYFILTGRTVYSGDTVMKRILAHQTAPIPSLNSVRPDVPNWLDAIFRKMVAKQVTERYQSMTELLTALVASVTSALENEDFDISLAARRDLLEHRSPQRGDRTQDTGTDAIREPHFDADPAYHPHLARNIVRSGQKTRKSRKRLFTAALVYLVSLAALAAIIYLLIA